jgi:hypothetical protein
MAFLRSAASRRLRSLATAPITSRSAVVVPRSQFCHLSTSRHATLGVVRPAVPKTLALVRFQSTERKNVNEIDAKAEERAHAGRINPHPEYVSATSSTHAINSEVAASPGQRGQRDADETEMLGGVKSDLVRSHIT